MNARSKRQCRHRLGLQRAIRGRKVLQPLLATFEREDIRTTAFVGPAERCRCITRHHYHHYRGFYGTQRKLLEKEEPKRAKSLLYAYRGLLTGIHLLRTGVVEANLIFLNENFRLPWIPDLIASKTAEKVTPAALDWLFHAQRLEELERELETAFTVSKLPEDRDKLP